MVMENCSPDMEEKTSSLEKKCLSISKTVSRIIRVRKIFDTFIFTFEMNSIADSAIPGKIKRRYFTGRAVKSNVRIPRTIPKQGKNILLNISNLYLAKSSVHDALRRAPGFHAADGSDRRCHLCSPSKASADLKGTGALHTGTP